jgi:hypothetical protein
MDQFHLFIRQILKKFHSSLSYFNKLLAAIIRQAYGKCFIDSTTTACYFIVRPITNKPSNNIFKATVRQYEGGYPFINARVFGSHLTSIPFQPSQCASEN